MYEITAYDRTGELGGNYSKVPITTINIAGGNLNLAREIYELVRANVPGHSDVELITITETITSEVVERQDAFR